MRLRLNVAILLAAIFLTPALAIACGGDPVDDTQPVVPTAAGVPAIAADAEEPPPRPTPESGGARVTPTTVYPRVTGPTASPSIPTPTPTLLVPTAPAVTIVPGTPTPKRDSTEIEYVPTPTPTVDIPAPTPTIDTVLQIARGMRLVERNNCLGCHSLDGEAYSAPTFKGLFGSIRQFEGGATVTADEAYLWESIKRPNEKIVRDYFSGAMPTVFFDEVEINAMVEYIKSLSR